MALSLAGPASAAPRVNLGKIEARLYLADKGQWSDDKLAKSSTWTGWNTIIGEGDAGGAASDIMIAVPLSSTGADDAISAIMPLVVTAKAGKRILASRTIKGRLIPYKGATRAAVYLTDAACAGRIDITASFGKQVRKARLNMDCGE